MTTELILDIAAGVIVLGFAVFGAWRGLIRTVAGLAVIVLALVGARFISANFSQPLAEQVEPVLEERLSRALVEQKDRILADVRERLEEQQAALSGEAAEAAEENLYAALPEAVRGLIPESIRDRIQSAIQSTVGNLGDGVSDALFAGEEEAAEETAGAISEAMRPALLDFLTSIFSSVLFAVSFVVLSILLRLAANLLNVLVKQIPGIGGINTLGGGLVGLVEGLALLLAVVLVLGGMGLFDAPPLSDTRFLHGVYALLFGR